MSVCVCGGGGACVCVCVCVCGRLHCMNEIVTLLNLNCTSNLNTWLIVMFCQFVNVLHEWNVTRTNSCVHLNVIGE